LLNYGRILSNVRAQDAQFQALILAYQSTVLTAGQEVENGLAQFLKSQEQVKFLAESVKAAESAVKIALAQYKGGTIDFNRVALVQQNLVLQQNLLAQAQGSIALGLVQVYRALGGGWEIRLTGCEPAKPLLVCPSPASTQRCLRRSRCRLARSTGARSADWGIAPGAARAGRPTQGSVRPTRG